MFVAATQAAEETEGAMCLMSDSAREQSDASFGGPAVALREGGPDDVDGPPKGGDGPAKAGHYVPSDVASGFSRTDQTSIAIPKSSNLEGGDLPPVRMVVDPY